MGQYRGPRADRGAQQLADADLVAIVLPTDEDTVVIEAVSGIGEGQLFQPRCRGPLRCRPQSCNAGPPR